MSQPELQARLVAAVNARLRIAERCTPVNADAGYVWEQRETDVYDAAGVTVATNIGPMDAEHIAANDPATVIRHCERDLNVLGRHSPIGRTGGWCDHCYDAETGDVPWPCDDIRDLATSLGIEVTS